MISNLRLRAHLYWQLFIVALSPKVRLPIKVLSIEETVDFIIRNNSSLVRFGEGEILLMNGGDLDFQTYDANLAEKMKTILSVQSSKGFVVCVPDVFNGDNSFRLSSKLWWEQHVQRFQKFYKDNYTSDWYGNAFISRPYMDWKKGSVPSNYFERLKQLWEDKDILIVEGQFSRSGVGNDLFENARSVQRILCPPSNAYARYEQIKTSTEKHANAKLVLCMLGPTAKALVYDLYMDGYRAVDLGHIDSEYEWFKMGSHKKVKLANKHTAEHNFDDDVGEIDDSLYKSQIIAVLTD